MEKQSKLIKYMKPKTEGGEIFESSDMDIDSMDNKMPGNEKKQTNMINFLRKFDQAALDVMEKYLNDNKYFLELPTKPKISLYEDVVIIVEYWKAFESLKKDRTKTVEQLCEKLQPIIKRSKVTIKERISKKLCRCSVEEVLEAIKNKKDLSFDKNEKAKKNNQNTEQGDHPQHPVKVEPHVISQTTIQAQSTNGLSKEQIFASKKNNKDGAKLMNAVTKPANNRLYQYGKKEIKERIYIYANSEAKHLIHFNQSSFNEMKEKYHIQLPFHPKASSPTPIVIESQESQPVENQAAEANDKLSGIQHLKNMSSKELEVFIQSIKEKTSQVINDSNENEPNQGHKQLQSYLQAIQQLQTKLINAETAKVEQLQEDISSEVSADKEKLQNRVTNSTGKKTAEPERQTPQKQAQILQDQQNKKLLYKLNNNPKFLELITKNPETMHEYLWEEEEDNILFSFKFNPEAYRMEMICLLRYKTRAAILVRMKFLNLDVNFSLIEQINNLESKGEAAVPIEQELMDIE